MVDVQSYQPVKWQYVTRTHAQTQTLKHNISKAENSMAK